jgi:hypothetical protein
MSMAQLERRSVSSRCLFYWIWIVPATFFRRYVSVRIVWGWIKIQLKKLAAIFVSYHLYQPIGRFLIRQGRCVNHEVIC